MSNIADLQKTIPQIVWRSLPKATVRAADSDDEAPKPLIEGYAAVFDAPSEDLGGFREIVKPGAFKRTLKNGADVRALFNHDPNYVLGRTKSGTLTLAENLEGLHFQAEPPDTEWARSLHTSMKRGDIDQTSFQFGVVKDRWYEQDGTIMRDLLEVKLFDVSVVTFPAYPQTSASARSLLELLGKPIDFSKPEEIRAAIEQLKSFLPTDSSEPAHSGDEDLDNPEQRAKRLAFFERKTRAYELSL